MEMTGFELSPLWQIVILLVTGFCTWLFGKLQTKREQKQSDIKIIEGAVTPLLTSIKELTEHNNNLVKQYLDEQRLRMEIQEANRVLKEERDDLAREVSELGKKVDRLERTIKRLTANEKDHSADG